MKIVKEENFFSPGLDHLDNGEEIYRRKLKKKLEPRYNGKIVAIEVDSGKYFIGDTVIEAARKAKAEFPDRFFFFMRVGHKAVYKKRW